MADTSRAPAIGVHARGRGPGDSFSLPYFEVDDLPGAIDRVKALGGTVVHPGTRWAICKDSEGSPFGLALAAGASSDTHRLRTAAVDQGQPVEGSV